MFVLIWGVLCCVLCFFIQLCLTLCDPMDCSPPGSSVHRDSPDKNTGEKKKKEYWSGLPCPSPGNLPNLGIEPRSPAKSRQILSHLSHQGSPRILEWIAYPFSRESSQPRNWTRVFCFAGRFFTREAPIWGGERVNTRTGIKFVFFFLWIVSF